MGNALDFNTTKGQISTIMRFQAIALIKRKTFVSIMMAVINLLFSTSIKKKTNATQAERTKLSN